MYPEVSIIVPCYNERSTITLLLDALYAQTYPKSAMEVVIADGGSKDGTQKAILDWYSNKSELRICLVKNPKKIIPSALNAAINASGGEIIIRLDAHSKPNRDYVERIVASIEQGVAENVGGVWDIQPSSEHWIARGIAAAAGHPIGVGDARYRYTDKPAFVDTVPFGAFHRTLLEKIGMFDETLLTNEDYEFNTRIRQSGGKIWLDPNIRSVYYARKDLKSLVKQYWRYGYWKWHMLRSYPGTIRLRQALPPLFILSLILLLFLAPFFTAGLILFLGLTSTYALILFISGVQLSIHRKDLALTLSVPLAIACMHFAWGSGFLWGMLHPQKENKG